MGNILRLLARLAWRKIRNELRDSAVEELKERLKYEDDQPQPDIVEPPVLERDKQTTQTAFNDIQLDLERKAMGLMQSDPDIQRILQQNQRLLSNRQNPVDSPFNPAGQRVMGDLLQVLQQKLEPELKTTF